jgi:hypothetical protein
LAVRGGPRVDSYSLANRVECKVLQTAHLLLATFGETDFDEKPRLYRWTTLVLRTLATFGLSVADALLLQERRSCP